MNNLSDSHAAIYEEPIDERIRKFLKLENYFLKLKYHKERDTAYDSYVALYNLIMIYNTLSRVEVKSELIREIDFHKQRYSEYIKIDNSDKIKLNSIMEKQNVILNDLYNLKSNYLNDLNNDEFFQFCVKHYNSLNTEIGSGNVLNTNNCEISVCSTLDKNKIIILSAIDNLIKGAAGQAIQNMNLAFNYNPKLGLS